MKRTREIPLAAGVATGLTVGLGGVALGMLLARKEVQALRHLIQQATRAFVASKVRACGAAGRRRQDRGLHVRHLAQQACQAGEQVAQAAGEQHLPNAKEALSGALAYAGLNGKPAERAD